MKLLARVEEVFRISHHSVVLMRFLSDEGRIRVKEQIQLRSPDGQIRDTFVVGVEQVKYSLLQLAPPRDPYVIGISLPTEITKEDVPPGTEVWNFRD